jgi:RimJ/RimL family protein N-acetyltransferase
MMQPINDQRIIWRKGKKTLLCPLQESDLEAFQKAINTAEIQKYLLRTAPITAQDQYKWYEQTAKSDSNNITVAVCTLEYKLLGNMAITFDPIKRAAVTGSLLFPNECGKGYGTDAKMQLLAYAFLERDVRKVVSNILGYNARSIRYARRCGYQFTACIPREHFRPGKWRGEVMYTAWRDDWIQLWKQYQKQI